MTQKPASIHATMVAVGESAVLLRGRSGAGKSRLAQALIGEALALGLFARLVADDRVLISVRGGRVIARSPHAIAGLIEERGSGLLRVAHEPAAVARCVVDLGPIDASGDRPARMPEEADNMVEIAGVGLPRLRLDRDVQPIDAARRVLARLARR